ncbi:MAG: hypothetical protein ICV78_24185 [Tolypothrix sp. Co-bin9]|nr:hypothetical protein [Tolypothrix sp. Co-bin9]
MQLLKSENQKTNILPLFAIGTGCLHLLTLLVLLFHWSILQRLNRQTTLPSLVQLIDGRTITVNPQENLLRHPQAIRRFVGETMTLMLTWSRQQPPNVVWDVSSQLVKDDFHTKLQAQIQNLTSVKGLNNFNSSTEQILVIERISQPQLVAEGRWQVEMVAHQLVFNGSDRLGESIAFHKRVFVEATDQGVAALPTQPLPLQLAAYRISAARLQIYKICDLNDKICLKSSP